MEYPFDVDDILASEITIIENNCSESCVKLYSLQIECESYPSLTENWNYHLRNFSFNKEVSRKIYFLENIISSLGISSAQAQGLNVPITTIEKFQNSPGQKIYMIRNSHMSRQVIGFLKIGRKHLYLCDNNGSRSEVYPLCLLDFYIHASLQRQGHGQKLFSAMLTAEGVEAEKMAIDRPSDKCLAFLHRHYGLKDPVQLYNNFIIFRGFSYDKADVEEEYFASCPSPQSSSANSSPISPFSNNCRGNFRHSISANDLSPSPNAHSHSQRSWDTLQSSWNVLGVKPLDYSPTTR